MDRRCETCGSAFSTRPALVRMGYARYCSRKCFGAAKRTQVERVCETCGNRFSAKAAEVAHGKGRFCSHDCFNASRRVIKKAGVPHRLTRAKGHPIAPPSGIAPISRLTLYDKIGPGAHPCHWCGVLVEWRPGVGVRDPGALLVDHLDHDATNDDPENLVPSCNPCNAHRRSSGTSAIIQPGEPTVIDSHGHRRRAVQRTCEFCGQAFLLCTSETRPGRGRFCSLSCARSGPRG